MRRRGKRESAQFYNGRALSAYSVCEIVRLLESGDVKTRAAAIAMWKRLSAPDGNMRTCINTIGGSEVSDPQAFCKDLWTKAGRPKLPRSVRHAKPRKHV